MIKEDYVIQTNTCACVSALGMICCLFFKCDKNSTTRLRFLYNVLPVFAKVPHSHCNAVKIYLLKAQKGETYMRIKSIESSYIVP